MDFNAIVEDGSYDHSILYEVTRLDPRTPMVDIHLRILRDATEADVVRRVTKAIGSTDTNYSRSRNLRYTRILEISLDGKVSLDDLSTKDPIYSMDVIGAGVVGSENDALNDDYVEYGSVANIVSSRVFPILTNLTLSTMPSMRDLTSISNMSMRNLTWNIRSLQLSGVYVNSNFLSVINLDTIQELSMYNVNLLRGQNVELGHLKGSRIRTLTLTATVFDSLDNLPDSLKKLSFTTRRDNVSNLRNLKLTYLDIPEVTDYLDNIPWPTLKTLVVHPTLIDRARQAARSWPQVRVTT